MGGSFLLEGRDQNCQRGKTPSLISQLVPTTWTMRCDCFLPALQIMCTQHILTVISEYSESMKDLTDVSLCCFKMKGNSRFQMLHLPFTVSIIIIITNIIIVIIFIVFNVPLDVNFVLRCE